MKKILTSKCWILVALLIGLLVWVLMRPCYAIAADPELLIEFAMDPPESAQYIVEYRLQVTKDSTIGPETIGTMIVTDPTVMEWTDTFYDIPMGKTLDYYMQSVDGDGDIGFSQAYPFKLTGKAVIIHIKRVK
jgi:hypothetical protein